jgi:antitoxin (DNA-binding transcriptional repressor) of toxin-antitoxin stability system
MSVARVRRKLHDVIHGVAFTGQPIDVLFHGKPIVRIVPIPREKPEQNEDNGTNRPILPISMIEPIVTDITQDLE